MKAKTVKGLRKHARMRFGIIHYRYTHYFVRLREGRPPQHYFPPRPTGNEMLQEYLERLRERRIYHSLWTFVCVCVQLVSKLHISQTWKLQAFFRHAQLWRSKELCFLLLVSNFFEVLMMCSYWNNCMQLSENNAVVVTVIMYIQQYQQLDVICNTHV